MNITEAIKIVYATKPESLNYPQNTNKDTCDKWNPVNTTCFYSEFHKCNPNEYGCIF
jgi:hypothetical protein